jgi:3',5'-cyclic AMP phosphodiesterase CpdA
VTAVSVILVSDTHLSPTAPDAQANWDAVLGYIGAAAPDVVIHLGDLSLDGTHSLGDLQYGREQLDRLAVPWYAVPGNHDVGDNPWPGAPEDSTVDRDRNQRWLEVIGADLWSLTIGGWTFLAINAQLLGSGLEYEARQWSWLEEQLREHSENKQIALITHKPMAAAGPELAASPPYRFWPPSARHRLGDLLKDKPPALIVSGHVHQYRLLRLDGTDHVWAPTTWAVLPDEVQPVLGAKRCGIVSLTLSAGTPVQPQLIEPAGIAQLTVSRDIPDPYHR